MRLRLTWLLSSTLAILLAGCGGGAATATSATSSVPPPVPAMVVIASGDDQDGTTSDPVPVDIHIKVSDDKGQALAGIAVHLEVTGGGGTVPQSDLTTNADGEVQTPWTLGPTPGINTFEAQLSGGQSAVATATASTCDLINCVDARVGDDPNDWKVLDLQTYDGSGEAMHPDIVRGGPGLRWLWLAATPYPNSDETRENPSLFQSHNGRFWRIPRGLANPVVKPVDGYLSDPDLVFDPASQRFWLYYRNAALEQNIIRVKRSFDGVRWDPAIEVLRVPSHQAVSPTVVRGAPDAPWIMWVIDAGTSGCNSRLTTVQRRISPDGINWSAATATDLAQPGQLIWHLDIEWVPARAEYWALYNAYPAGSNCATPAVYFARSRDGVAWTTYPSPVVRKGVLPALRDVVYRSTMLVNDNADSVRLYVSGARFENSVYTWSTATMARRVDELFADITVPPTNRPGDPIRHDLPPPEPDLGPATGGGSSIPAAPPLIRRLRP